MHPDTESWLTDEETPYEINRYRHPMDLVRFIYSPAAGHDLHNVTTGEWEMTIQSQAAKAALDTMPDMFGDIATRPQPQLAIWYHHHWKTIRAALSQPEVAEVRVPTYHSLPVTGEVAGADARRWRIGAIPATMKDEEYPSLPLWYTQVWELGHVVARIYGDSPDAAQINAKEIAHLWNNALAAYDKTKGEVK